MNGIQSGFKANLIRELKIDIHFEDSVRHAEEILKESPKTVVVLVRQPWNLGYSDTNGNSQLIIAQDKRNVPRLVAAYDALTKKLV